MGRYRWIPVSEPVPELAYRGAISKLQRHFPLADEIMEPGEEADTNVHIRSLNPELCRNDQYSPERQRAMLAQKELGAVVASLGRAAVDLLFPSRCLGCGRGRTFLCDGCASQLARALPPRCPRCWEPRAIAGDCLACQRQPPAFDALRTAFVYQGLARELVHALKYRGVSALAGVMGGLLADAVRSHSLDADLAVPVPLSGLRKRTRGYNQSEALARALGRELVIPAETNAIARRRHTQPQARRADAEARRANVAGAFVARRKSVEGCSVLLIDDVATTGATLSACASALREAGAEKVWAVAFARED